MVEQDISSGASVSLSALAGRAEFNELRELVTRDADALSKTLIGAGCLTPAVNEQHRSTIPVTSGILRSMLLPDRAGRALASPSSDRPPSGSRRVATAAASTSAAAASASTTTASQAPAVAHGMPVMEGAMPEARVLETGAGVVWSGAAALVAGFWWLLFLPVRCFCWTWRMVVAFRAAIATVGAAIWAFITGPNFLAWLWTLWTTDPEVVKVHLRRGFNKTQAGIGVVDYGWSCLLEVISYAGQCLERIWGRPAFSMESAAPDATPSSDATPGSGSTEPTPDTSPASEDTPAPAPAGPAPKLMPTSKSRLASDTTPASKPRSPGLCVLTLCHLAALTTPQTADVYTCVMAQLKQLRQGYDGPGKIEASQLPQRAEWSWAEVEAGLADVVPAMYQFEGLGRLVKRHNL